LKAEIRKLEAEKDMLEAEKKDWLKEQKHAEEILLKYSSAERDDKNKIKVLQMANTALNDFFRYMHGLELSAEDIPSVRQAAEALVTSVELYWNGIDNNGLLARWQAVLKG
jgi:hypothetical protein